MPGNLMGFFSGHETGIIRTGELYEQDEIERFQKFW